MTLFSLAWYPPAETKISFTAIIKAALNSKANSFEEKLSNYLGVSGCVLGNNGRSLLATLLRELNKLEANKKKTEVLIPGYTCYTVAASIARAGLRIRAYDMDPKTLCPDMDSIKKNTGKKTLAIIHQHLFGIPSPVNSLKSIARDNGIYLVEDAAQALGGKLNGIPLGTTGDFGLYSFGRGKPLPLGSGGALVGNNINLLGKIRRNKPRLGIIDLVKTGATQVLSNPGVYGLMEALPLGLGSTVFDPGFKISSMPCLLKKLGQFSLDTLETLNTHRRKIAGIYSQVLRNDYLVSIPAQATPIFIRFPVIAGVHHIPGKLLRLGVRRMYPRAILDEPQIRPYLAEGNIGTPGASEIASTLVTLPTHMAISAKTAEVIATDVSEFLSL